MMAVRHERVLPWPRGSGSSAVAACTCGWRSAPRANGEFANQAWERHALEACERGDGDADASP
jgi:hypothetical protein